MGGGAGPRWEGRKALFQAADDDASHDLKIKFRTLKKCACGENKLPSVQPGRSAESTSDGATAGHKSSRRESRRSSQDRHSRTL